MSQVVTEVHIVLPGLFDLPLDELSIDFTQRKLPRLNHLLRFASAEINHNFTIDAILCSVFGWPAPSSQSVLPLARVFADGCKGEGLLVQPVFLRPDLGNATIFPIERSEQNLADCRRLLTDLRVMFAEDLQLVEVDEGLFLMHLQSCRVPDHYPHILSVLGKSARPYMAKARENLEWHRLLNEMQMFLHQHEVNQQRSARGLFPINSLWCWGSGAMHACTRDIDCFCDNPLLRDFTKKLGISTLPLGAISNATSSADRLIIDLRLLEAIKMNQTTRLENLLLDIETRVLGAVLEASLKTTIRLHAGFGVDLRFGLNARFKFWRPRRTLVDFQSKYQSPDSLSAPALPQHRGP